MWCSAVYIPYRDETPLETVSGTQILSFYKLFLVQQQEGAATTATTTNTYWPYQSEEKTKVISMDAPLTCGIL